MAPAASWWSGKPGRLQPGRCVRAAFLELGRAGGRAVSGQHVLHGSPGRTLGGRARAGVRGGVAERQRAGRILQWHLRPALRRLRRLVSAASSRSTAARSAFQDEAVVASNDSGFVVLWSSLDGRSPGVYGRRFDGGGVAQASEFRVNANVPLAQWTTIWRRTAGRTWWCGTSTRWWAAASTDSASPPAPTPSSTPTRTTIRSCASVARVDGSGFVVVWTSQFQDGSSYGIFGRRLKLLRRLRRRRQRCRRSAHRHAARAALRVRVPRRDADHRRGGRRLYACDAPSIEAYLAGKV